MDHGDDEWPRLPRQEVHYCSACESHTARLTCQVLRMPERHRPLFWWWWSQLIRTKLLGLNEIGLCSQISFACLEVVNLGRQQMNAGGTRSRESGRDGDHDAGLQDDGATYDLTASWTLATGFCLSSRFSRFWPCHFLMGFYYCGEARVSKRKRARDML